MDIQDKLELIHTKILEFEKNINLLHDDNVDSLILQNDHDTLLEAMYDLDNTDPLTHLLYGIFGGALVVACCVTIMIYVMCHIMKRAAVRALTRNYQV